jgi:arylformamidase
MKIIDLSQIIYDGMPVYPGDPEVKIKPVFTVEKDEWAVSGIEMVTHDGTHINVPRHIDPKGKALNEYSVNDFISVAKVYSIDEELDSKKAYIFVDHQITMDIAKELVKAGVKMVGLSDKFDFDLEAERYLLEQGVISYEKLTNTEHLPKDTQFTFYGIPLNIKDSDGSPVRAFAELKL